MKVRIKFRKYGSMKFIGHLDTMRYFQKAIRRAGLPVSYSEGFSPHQIMSFAAPLGVGLESNGEYMDLVYTEPAEIGAAKTVERLNAAMAEGVEILSAVRLPEEAGNAMASVAAAKYTVRFREGYDPGFDWISQLSDLYGQPSIPVVKKTKKSEMEFDLKPHIFELETKAEEAVMLVDASSAGNIKPGLVIEALFRKADAKLPPFALQIIREETYGLREENGRAFLAPLEAFGGVF